MADKYEHITFVKSTDNLNIWKDEDTDITYAVDKNLIIRPPASIFAAIDEDEHNLQKERI